MFYKTVLTGLLGVWFSVAAMAQTAPKAPATPATTSVPSASVPVPGATPGMQPSIEQMQQQLLSRFDVDRNGVLSDQEKLMAQEAMRREGINLGIPPGGFPGADQFAKQFDRDGDGKLSPQEAFAAQAAYQRMMGGGAHGGMRGGLRSGGGGGGGGGASAIPPQPLLAPNGADNNGAKSGNALVKRFDKNGDGKLNAEEKAAAQAELKKEKGKGKDAKGKDGEPK
jgi:hypothetical protein